MDMFFAKHYILIIIKPGAFLNWEVSVSLCVCVCLCVCPPQAIKNHSHEMKSITKQTSPTAFRFLYMTLAINNIKGVTLAIKCITSYYQRRTK